MKRKRARIVVEYEVDLDPVVGFGHTPDSWAKWIVKSPTLMQNKHYHPTARIINAVEVEDSVTSVFDRALLYS